MIAGRAFGSRLLVGTGKFSSARVMKGALQTSGTEIVTVALRRVDLDDRQDNILSNLDTSRYLLLPNTSGARTAEEAVRLARLARAAGCEPWVKLEITPDPQYLLPDPVETLKAAEILVKEGFIVLPYINADPVLARRLEDVGTATVMPLGAPIRVNRAVKTRELIRSSSKRRISGRRGRGPRCAIPRGGGNGDGADAVLVNGNRRDEIGDGGPLEREWAGARPFSPVRTPAQRCGGIQSAHGFLR
jgi:thiazole synthase